MGLDMLTCYNEGIQKRTGARDDRVDDKMSIAIMKWSCVPQDYTGIKIREKEGQTARSVVRSACKDF